MLSLLGILPVVLAWFACYCLARELAVRQYIDADWRLSWALASVGWGTLVALTIELGSLAQLLTAPVLWGVWTIVNISLFCAMVSLMRKRGVRISEALQAWSRSWRASFAEWPMDARCYLGMTALFVVVLFGIAVIFATTNWDSLNYHLPRIMHWMQAGSIEHFPTNNSRQIEFAPWQSFLSMTLYLLWGGDRLLNLVQWCAMVGSLVLVPYILKALLCRQDIPSAQRHRLTAFALVLVVTLPVGLVECMNPQNDYTTAFWLCCLATFAFALVRNPDSLWYMLGAALACGLATLTKTTTYVYAAPLILGFGVWWISRRFPWQIKVRHGALFCLVFLSLNAGHAIRNHVVFGSPLGSEHILKLEKNSPVSLSGTAANVVRNLSLHSGGGIKPATTAFQAVLKEAHLWTGRAFADAETTYRGLFYMNPSFFVFDSFAACTYHVILIFLALILAAWKFRKDRAVLWHSAWIVASFVLFCALLKWQYNHSRLHLAYLLLFVPVIAATVARFLPRSGLAIVSAALVVFGGYTLAKNASRPLFDSKRWSMAREQQYLATHAPEYNEPLQRMADALVAAGCDNVGMKLGFDDPEYVIWAMLRNRGFAGALHHVSVEDASAKIASRYRAPEVILTKGRTPPATVTNSYPFSARFGPFLLLSREALQEVSPQVQSFSQNNQR